MNTNILIGGEPTVGKSYITRILSDKFKLPWISTDGIRGMMREVVNRDDYKSLFYLDRDDNAIEEYLSSHSVQQILDDHIEENIDVWKGTKAFLDTDHVWNKFIIEGVAVLPGFVSKHQPEKYKVMPIFLVDANYERIKHIVYNKGLWNGSTAFSDKVKDIEIEWTVLFNDFIETEAKKYGYPIYNTTDERQLQQLIQEVETWFVK